ncbi:unnamed protein product [Mytilus coruscus]|uniref:Uncharacterized protein n=1 Tax=Mytilus coruscus TaxID=42192 RepID=A0A6J8E5R8_MYTCO|nr:unnamed protein product [Mytilus coruscus]
MIIIVLCAVFCRLLFASSLSSFRHVKKHIKEHITGKVSYRFEKKHLSNTLLQTFYGTMKIAIGLLTLVVMYVKATPEVNHLIEIDHQGREIHMDVIHDTEDKTVIAVIGDVSKYQNGIPTVNFHDYNTGYGVLKNINRKACILTKTPVPMGTDEKYRIGFTTEVHDHFLKIIPAKMSYDDVKALAGEKLASYCKDYTTLYAEVTPVNKHSRLKREAAEIVLNIANNWCVFSSCSFELARHIILFGKAIASKYLLQIVTLYRIMKILVALSILWVVYVETAPEVNHLIEIDHQGREVHMDVIHDSVDKTVIAVIGDVSKYKNGIPTVNLHDYNTGYGVLKNINRKACILTKTPVPMGTDEKYRVGVTTEVHDHFLKIIPVKMSYDDVKASSGERLASFCKDYTTLYAEVTPMNKPSRQKRDTTREDTDFEDVAAWCVFSKCTFRLSAFNAALGASEKLI